MKKDYKKCQVQFCSGYGGNGAVANVYDENSNVIARIDITDLENKLGRLIRGGEFIFLDKKRKYQYISLK
jgi:hypothetical protein